MHAMLRMLASVDSTRPRRIQGIRYVKGFPYNRIGIHTIVWELSRSRQRVSWDRSILPQRPGDADGGDAALRSATWRPGKGGDHAPWYYTPRRPTSLEEAED